jgi:tRNA (Thr-GGU) A37 N-methylase
MRGGPRTEFDWTQAALAEGLRCYDQGEYFTAYEAWETVWLEAYEPDRTFLQGLIQVTVAFHHLQRDNRPHGVFATRSPRRPNPIGLTVVELLRCEDGLLRVRGIDMLDGTPILDIKPYLSSVPLRRCVADGWQRLRQAKSDAPKSLSTS